jgi:1,4-dihydroxy-2-naphthoyl-CoA hydrolase
MTTPPELAPVFTERQKGHLPGILGLEWETVQHGLVRGRFTVEKRHMAPNGFLHAASVIALADSACGYGSFASLPEGASGFTTIEVKSNFLGTAREGVVSTEARLVHGGRTTQLWDAEVRHEDTGKVIALFRCTQAVLWPKA